MASPHMIAAAQRRHAEDWNRIRGRHSQFADTVNMLSTDPGRAAWWKVFGDKNRDAVRRAVRGTAKVLDQCNTILDTLNDGDGSLKRIGSR